jgi:peptidoglycan/LPS O-acetylase OafA/YrhL
MLNNLTGLRFYAAMWVFLYHFSVYIGLGNIFFDKGYLGVDIFFVLSGFILTYAYQKSFFGEKITFKTYCHFIIKRFAKIYPLHILTFVIVGILLYCCKYLLHQENLIIRNDHIISNLLMTHAWNINDALSWNTHSWSLSAEWFAYLFLFVLAAFVLRINRFFGLMILITVVVYFIAKWFNVDRFSLNHYSYNGLERIIPEFFLGIILCLLRLRYEISKRAATFIFVLGFTLMLLILVFDYKVDALCILAFGSIVYALSFYTHLDRFFSSARLIYFGNISFAFYMFQLIAFYLLKPFQNYLEYVGMAEDYRLGLQLLLLFFINITLAAAAYRYFEEPMRVLLVNKLIKSQNRNA